MYQYTKEAFKKEIEENFNFREINVNDNDDEYEINIYTIPPAYNRMVEKAERLKEKWEEDGYEVSILTFRPSWNIQFTLYL